METMKVLTRDGINPNILATEYAVRGKLVLKANEIDREIKESKRKGKESGRPFDKVVFCNIGNPQFCNQKPLTYIRQVVAMVEYTPLMQRAEVFPSDLVAHAKAIADATGCIGTTGAYTHSMGLPFVRQSVARFIERRDGTPTTPENIFVTDGASTGIKMVLNMLISHHHHGVMIPIPQYPLYSASIAQFGGTQIPYYLDEDKNWNIDMESVREEYRKAVAAGKLIKGFVVINPGNPTGQVLDVHNMKEIINFCYANHILLLADEVYQENVYGSTPFTSFRKVLLSMDKKIREGLELVSFFSVSKGFYGECGKRGGYMHLENIEEFAHQQLYKLASVNLCSNVVGQEVLELVVNPPRPGDESYDTYHQEKQGILDSLARKARTLQQALNACQGVTCSEAQGALYLFPRVDLPGKFVEECDLRDEKPDAEYCRQMLLQAGVCVVPGSGFGQREGTYHYRIAFLPQESEITKVAERITMFHNAFMRVYE